MKKLRPVPEWMEQEIQKARLTFGIDDFWLIFAGITQNPDGTRTANGAAIVDPIYLQATIELNSNLKTGSIATRTILHEVGHVAMFEIDHLVEQYILRAVLDDTQAEVLRQMYKNAVERFLQRLTRGIERNENY